MVRPPPWMPKERAGTAKYCGVLTVDGDNGEVEDRKRDRGHQAEHVLPLSGLRAAVDAKHFDRIPACQ